MIELPAGTAPSLSGRTGGPLLAWFDVAKRDMPWRRTKDPYAIWVSEIMLQQTPVVTVIPYWNRWMNRFPTTAALASADEQEVLSMWQGLGYYRRCRMLLQGARWVEAHGMPTTAAGWLKVPGIGPYTAGAIASIAFDEPAPLVDGNVERVYARLTGDDSRGKDLHNAAWRWANQNVFAERPGDWNQALMELGATVCKPFAPDCQACPLSQKCVAFLSRRVEDLPTKSPKVQAVKLFQVVWVPIHENRFGVRQIPAGQWWEGMWEFPRADVGSDELMAIVGEGWLESIGIVRHSVTHHRITIDVNLVRCESPSEQLIWLSIDKLADLPMPAPQRKILRMVLGQMGG
jgi:A/G-specific adenine glycosylase